jgi:xylulokinase
VSYFIGIDTSTTATKALLMDGAGVAVGVGRADYGYETPRPLWSEQDPDLWWQGTITAIRSVLADAGVDAREVAAIGLTGQMHGLTLLDSRGGVLRPAILWNDQRTGAECDQIRDTVGRQRLIAITGNDALTGFTAPKLLWVRDHEPEVYTEIAHVLLPKDYVRLKLTEEYATDRAGGSGTLLFDLAGRDWSQEILADLEIPSEWLPETHEGPAVTGVVSRTAAAEIGLVAGTPVVAGGGDQAANGVGVGAVTEGIAAVSLGTSGVVFSATASPIIESEARLHSFCHAVPGTWHLMGVMLSAAGSLRWFRDAIAPELSFEEIGGAAEEIPAGSDGLIFLPYLTGERTPYPDPDARGAFIGLTVRHDLRHMARAVLEGVAFGLRDSLELIGQQVAVDEVRIAGGGASSVVWRQIVADVFGTEVRDGGTTESAAHGAALLAAVGAGWFETVPEACLTAVDLGDTTTVGTASDRYAQVYPIYRNLYPSLRESFGRLSELDS